ncbi:MAG: hypothetical protein EYC70_05830 [Planctomycetota bacterium]|nr:MAG: hypothetical protein EYC70_05830 [Planctomycetota bacterium]
MGRLSRAFRLWPLLIPACAATDHVANGDRHFRLEEFQHAVTEYEAAGAAQSSDPELQQRLQEARLRVFTAGAMDLLHLERPADALRILDIAADLQPGHPHVRELRARAQRQMAEDYAEIGAAYYENDAPREAAAAYAQALAWDPDYEPAQKGLALAQDQAARLHRAGERLYFRALEDLNAGNDLRAYAALTHATTYWGPESRAGERLDEISARLAAERFDTAKVYLEAGLLGPAWLELRNSDRLQPGNSEVEQLLAQVENELSAARVLIEADMAVRGGDTERAEGLVARAGALAGDVYAEPIAEIQRRSQQERLRQKYLVAYAAELDNQVVGARDLYLQVLEEGGGADVSERYQLLKRRVELADTAYQEALAAQAAGDAAAYAAKLAETLRLARDYADALPRFIELQQAKAAASPPDAAPDAPADAPPDAPPEKPPQN